MKLSVIIPVYNEKNTILEVIGRVAAVPVDKEIIVVDDGSTDGTREILQQAEIPSLREGENIRVILKEKNGGKGSALREGLRHAGGDAVIIQDADLELNPEQYPALLEPVACGTVDVVYGSRFLQEQQHVPFVSFMANKFLTWLTNILFSARITDMETCYKLCRRDLLASLDLKANKFEIEPEITCKILKRGYKIKEVPVSYAPRRQGKKINWRDGVNAVFYLFKYRFCK